MLRNPDKAAIVYRGRRITFKTLCQRVNRLSNALTALDISGGDKVAVLLGNVPELIEVLMACAKIGAICVPVNYRFVSSEISYVVNNSESTVFIYGKQYNNAVLSSKGSLPLVRHYVVVGGNNDGGDPEYEDIIGKASDRNPDVEIPVSTPWFIGYTSGTTGFPKGAVQTHYSMILNAISMALEWHISYLSRMLLIMPLFHSNSIWFSLACLYTGATIVLYDGGSFDPERVLGLIEDQKVTFTSMVPTMYTIILENVKKDTYDISTICDLLCSSAPLLTKTKEGILDFFKNIRLHEGYGSTEAGAVTALKPSDQLRKVRSIGQPILNQKVRLLDRDGNDVPVGEIGELYSYGPTLFSGYYKMPEKTKDTFRGKWFSAGDMAMMDEDGYYYLVDRKKDMIISGGENIYPTEVEDVLIQHPSVLEAAVIGVPDEKWGEAVKAVIVLRENKKVNEQQIIEHCKKHLAGYKKPRSVTFVEKLPKSPTGKILRKDIRKVYLESENVFK